jgi:hypothetical protein
MAVLFGIVTAEARQGFGRHARRPLGSGSGNFLLSPMPLLADNTEISVLPEYPAAFILSG